MADYNSITPEIAAQLMESPRVQDTKVKQQLSSLIPQPEVPASIAASQPEVPASIAAPTPTEEAVDPLADTLSAEQYIDPRIQDKAAMEAQKTPETMTRKEREAHAKKLLDERLTQQINDGEIEPEEAVKMLGISQIQEEVAEQEKLRGAQADIEGRQGHIDEKWNKYLKDKNTIDQLNQLGSRQEGYIPKPDPNITDYLDKEDISFAAQSGMDIPPAAAARAEEELKQADAAAEKEDALKVERDIVNQQQAQGQVAAEKQQQAIKTEQKAVKNIEEKNKKIETRFTSLSDLFENASTGRKFSAGLAIMLGGLSQGLTGGKTNPALEVLENEFKNNIAMHKQGLILMDQKLQQAGNSLKDEKTRAEIQRVRLDIATKKKDLEQIQLMEEIASMSGESIPKNVLAKVRPGSPVDKLLIVTPDGETFKGNNPEAVKTARDTVNEVQPALDSLNQLIDAVGKVDKLSPTTRAEYGTKIAALVGKLRLPLTGPGPLTDTEYARLKEIIGDPSKIFTLDSMEKAKLTSVKDLLENDMKQKLRSAGVEMKPSANEIRVNQLMKANSKNKNFSKLDAIVTLKRLNKWD